mgnify:FL=1
MYSHIFNPTTNKKCPVNSKPGLDILQRYLEQLVGGKPRPNIKMHIQPKITEIVGPISLHLWRIKCPNNSIKKILLLGDEHSAVSKNCPTRRQYCQDLDDFVSDILTECKRKKLCVDFFLEEKQKKLSAPKYLKGGAPTKRIPSGRQLIDHMKNTYSKCSWHSRHKKYDNEKCQLNNLRFQNFDLRFSNAGAARTANKLDSLLYYMKTNTAYNHRKYYSLLADYILGKHISNNKAVKLDRILQTILRSANPNQTPSLTKKYNLKDIKHDMANFRTLVQKEYTKFSKYKERYLPNNKLDLREYVKRVIGKKYKATKSFEEYTHLFTDLYVLSRIFMEFSYNKDKINRSPPNCPIMRNKRKTRNISPNKVIILAGYDHIDVYNNVLKYYFPNGLQYSTRIVNMNKTLKVANINPKIASFDIILKSFVNKY